ncbi:outer membrane beta-barrel family protein [Sphingobacterium oryzagri]|uniref:Outer membrane beta-barrel family protein n=1 Tax=Sphingobacterium oryzagri TaxID=3025669 RepID=A0ABY7WG46_9SPHI|nr:outer membrane beta-barrel family protein [Sphingobacterium sp. KACC 22765]WDF68614.1 outer membrane beta-barrel family protein [Sphingobacterium sp. KACC 22765]
MKKTTTYLTFNFCFLLLTAFAVQAQQTWKGEVNGKIYNAAQEPMANVSVQLLTAKAAAVMKTGVSDENGTYIISNIPDGEFIIQVSSVGYESAKSSSFTIKGNSLTLADMILLPQTQSLEAVTVEGKVPLVQQRDGKLILNVENSTLAAGNNALEVIQRAPGVSVDKDENLQLMGQQGVNVTIDGRQTFMTGEQLATFLKSMNGDQIKSVEVTTGRTAKDDAEGSVGTINITLKKNRLEGFNGTWLASAAQGQHFRGNSSLTLNYKKKNTTLFGNYGYTQNKRQFDLDLMRTIASNDLTRVFDQEADLIETNKTHNYKVGIEQRTSDRNTMLLQFSGDNDDEQSLNSSRTQIGPQVGNVDSVLYTVTDSRTPFNRYSINFNNELKIDTLGGKLTFDLDWTAFRNRSDISYDYQTFFPTGGLVRAPEYWRTAMPVDIDIYVGRLDFVKHIAKGKFEAGVKYSRVKSDNNLAFEEFVDQTWQRFPFRQNHFVYTEQIAAGYLDYSREFGKASIKLGLRAEHTHSNAHAMTTDTINKRNYLDLFPSVSSSYAFNENNILSLSYARKISRPNYRYLNPMPYYIDKFTYTLGNPYLRPQYTDGFTLNYTFMKMFNFTLGTDITNDAMVESLGQDVETGESWIQQQNLAKTVTSYLNINAPAQIGKFWTMNNNLTGIYMHFKGEIAGEFANLGSFFFQGRSTNNFKIAKGFGAELSVNYNSPFLYNVYKIHTRWGTDVGVNYNFKDQRSSLKLAATDIFRTQKNNVSTNFAEFDSQFSQYNDNRTVRLTYTYKFGNLKQQTKRTSTDSEEKNRAL